MEAVLFSPPSSSQVERCLELLQRTNQLNLSTRRYTRTEFDALLCDSEAVAICTLVKDRFGEYGIVGFASLQRVGTDLYVSDFVMSCRVAQKRLEDAWLRWLSSAALRAGYEKLYAKYFKTDRNHVLLQAFTEAGFRPVETEGNCTLLEFDCNSVSKLSEIVHVTAANIVVIPKRLASPEDAVHEDAAR